MYNMYNMYNMVQIFCTILYKTLIAYCTIRQIFMYNIVQNISPMYMFHMLYILC